MPFFFAKLTPGRPDFPADLTAHESVVMKAHAAFLGEELAAGRLVVAGPVFGAEGAFGMGVFEADSLAAVEALLVRDPASEIGTYAISPMASAVARPRP